MGVSENAYTYSTNRIGEHLSNLSLISTNLSASSRINEVRTIVRYVVVTLYLLTFIFGVVGNSLTILVIMRNKRMKTVATCFILNLAVADDLFMLSLPFLAYNTYTGNWIFGSWMCTIMNALYRINLYASIFTMVLMSIDRYLAIVHPLSSIRYRTVKNAVVVCATIWGICCIIMTPIWMYSRTAPKPPRVPRDNGRDSKHVESVRTYMCTEIYPEGTDMQHKYFMTNFELLIGFVIPIIIMVLCYLKLLRHLVTDRVPAEDQTRRPIRKVTVMVFIVTLVFVICWTPYHIVKYTDVMRQRQFRTNRTNPTEDQFIRHIIFNTVAQALVFLSSCCNPFIYGISSRNFRELYMAAVCRWCRPAGRNRTQPPTTSYMTRSVRFERVQGETAIHLEATSTHRQVADDSPVTNNGVMETSAF